VKKLEQEMRYIRSMLKEHGLGKKADKEIIEDKENESENNFDMNQEELKEAIARERREVKEMQTKIEDDKKKFRDEQKVVDSLRYSDPVAFKQKSLLLEKVK